MWDVSYGSGTVRSDDRRCLGTEWELLCDHLRIGGIDECQKGMCQNYCVIVRRLAGSVHVDQLGQYHRISNAETPRAAQGDTIGLGSDEGIVLSHRDGCLGSPES